MSEEDIYNCLQEAVDGFWMAWQLLLRPDYNCPSLFRSGASCLVFRFPHRRPFPLNAVARSADWGGEWNWRGPPSHSICPCLLSTDAWAVCPYIHSWLLLPFLQQIISGNLISHRPILDLWSLTLYLWSSGPVINPWGFCFVYLQGFPAYNKEAYCRRLEWILLIG